MSLEGLASLLVAVCEGGLGAQKLVRQLLAGSAAFGGDTDQEGRFPAWYSGRQGPRPMDGPVMSATRPDRHSEHCVLNPR